MSATKKQEENAEFIHLHTHSHYSLLDGLSKPHELVKLAKEFNMSSIAVTDHGAMYGAIDFYQACKKEGIKPIIGVEAYVANRTRFDKESGIDNKRFHLTLLAETNEGYKNLIKLVTAAHLEGYYYKPRVDKDLLRLYGSGIIALSGCPAGELGRAILRSRDMARAEEIIHEHQEIFGKNNYFLEIMWHEDVENFNEWKDALIQLSRKTGVPLVATQDSHYPTLEHSRAHATLLAVSTGSDLGESGIFQGNGRYHFMSTDEALALFHEIPDAVYITKTIADRCNSMAIPLLTHA